MNWENSISHVFGICQKYTVCLFEQEINVKGLIISVSDFRQKTHFISTAPSNALVPVMLRISKRCSWDLLMQYQYRDTDGDRERR